MCSNGKEDYSWGRENTTDEDKGGDNTGAKNVKNRERKPTCQMIYFPQKLDQ